MLHVSHRPQRFSEFRGRSNRGTVESLQTALTSANGPHSFLFAGDSGCGKTTLARLAASELEKVLGGDCDLEEINAADFRGIDTVRQIIRNSQFPPLIGTFRFWIIDEAHQLSKDAQNGFLKLVEEPPEHTYFAFCSTDPQKIIPTVRNRCTTYEVTVLRDSEIEDLVLEVLDKELERDVDFLVVDGDGASELVEIVVEAAQGIPRRALVLLDQCRGLENIEDIREVAAIGLDFDLPPEAIELIRVLISDQVNRWERVADIYKKLDVPAEKLRQAILGYLRNSLVGSTAGKAERFARMMELLFKFDIYAAGPNMAWSLFLISQL